MDLLFQSRRIRNFLARYFEAARGFIELRRKFPQLRDFSKQHVTIRNSIQPYYNDYITRVSTYNWAISIKLAIIIISLCNNFKPKRILDLGTGFSSFIFNYYASQATEKPEIWSVDDSDDWLAKTKIYLGECNFPAENLENWNEFSKQKHEPFDLVLHDLGTMEFRLETLNEVINFVGPKGLLILDDIHRVSYGPYAKHALEKAGLTYYSLLFYTIDSLKRYALLAAAK